MKKKTFVGQLIRSYLIIAIIPLLVAMSLYFAATIKSERKNAEQQLQSAAQLAGAQVDSLLTNMSFLSINLVSHDNFMKAVKGLDIQRESVILQQEYYDQISAEICTYAIFSSQYNVTFFNNQGYLITSYRYNNGYNFKYRMSEEERNSISWYAEVQNNYGKEIIVPIQKSEIPRNGRETLALVRAIRDPGGVVGYLCVDIDVEELDYIWEIEQTLGTELKISTMDGKVLYCSKEFPEEKDYENYFQAENRQSDTQVLITMMMPKEDVYAKVISTIGAILLEALLLFALTLFTIIAFSRTLTKPLAILCEEMKNVTITNLYDKREVKEFERYDEIAYLYNQFHSMRKRLNVMIQKEVTSQKMYIQEQLKYLQAQINPHFMCNTLNVIAIMGSEQGSKEVYKACQQLASILQYSIADKGKGNTTIADEMQNIQDYLELMKLRYEHKLEYCVFYEDDIANIRIPRLVLEPFVENIFVHAYDSKHKCVRVNITGYMQKERWYIVIEDDGQGMEEGRLVCLREHIQSCCEKLLDGERISNREYGIGIENTIIRLYLYYEKDFWYELENRKDTGLKITLSGKSVKSGSDQNERNQSNYS